MSGVLWDGLKAAEHSQVQYGANSQPGKVDPSDSFRFKIKPLSRVHFLRPSPHGVACD